MEYGRCKSCGRLRNLSNWYVSKVSMACGNCGNTSAKPTYWLKWRERPMVCWWAIRENFRNNPSPVLWLLNVLYGVSAGLTHNAREDRLHV